MSISSHLSGDGRKLEIRIGDRFDFAQHRAFRDAYRSVELDDVQIVIDLSATSYMDSSALGMLLVLRERAGGDQADISLMGMNPTIIDILSVSRFKTLFHLR